MDCVAGFVSILGCWIVLIPGASILLLGLFFWFSIGGSCGFRCGLWVWVGGCMGK